MNVWSIIVTYNGMQWIERCLMALVAEQIDGNIVVVDNASTDGTVSLIESRFPTVRIINAGGNIGFGKANNVGIRFAVTNGADFVFLLNQDAYVAGNCLRSLVETMERTQDVGLVSPIHLAGDGRNLDFLFYKYLNPLDTPHLLGDLIRANFRREYETKFVNAAAWLLRVSMLKHVGIFHPIFDHYGEDREFVTRMRRQGFKILINPSSYILHDRVQSRKNNSYHGYHSSLNRNLLIALVEGQIEFSGVTIRLLILFVKNCFALRFRRAYGCISVWLTLKKKNRELKKTETSSYSLV
jgi:N-acetylglucosaminyl-diphospho-decaprenol L-rhamnosyltransferase